MIADQRISQAGTQQWAFDQTRLPIYVGFGFYFLLALSIIGTGKDQTLQLHACRARTNMFDCLKWEDSISWKFSSSDGGRGSGVPLVRTRASSRGARGGNAAGLISPNWRKLLKCSLSSTLSSSCSALSKEQSNVSTLHSVHLLLQLLAWPHTCSFVKPDQVLEFGDEASLVLCRPICPLEAHNMRLSGHYAHAQISDKMRL